MFVRNRMTANPVCVTPDTPVPDALELMKKRKIRRLPVTEDEKLVGIVTQLDLMRVSPSPATSLSIFEIHYLISKMTVREAMTPDPVAISPDATIEEAALLMRQRSIGGLPVVENGKVVGIITETDIFDSFIELLGVRRSGLRLTIQAEDKPGVLAEITQVIKEKGVNIISLAVFPLPEGNRANVVLRLNTDAEKPLLAELERHGFKVLHVSKTAQPGK
ncbi:MAG: CBS and ACT domain-containing protein [Syntrophothermus sp.]